MSHLTIRALHSLVRRSERLQHKLCKFARKMRNNPHRGDFIPSPEEVDALKKELTEIIERTYPFEVLHDQLQRVNTVNEDVLKNFKIITTAQKAVHDRIEGFQQTNEKSPS
jgi:hypothetical protein